jgi:predicted MFS family arabinose efflux permease
MTDTSTPRPPLFTYPFLTLSLTTLIGFANIAVFYGFYPYLIGIGISPFWASLLLALEPMTAFFLRPVISPRLSASNALAVMRGSMAVIALALLAYPWADTVPLLLLLRAVHGAAFVLLVSATTALLVHFVPPARSGQGFGIFTLATLLPFAFVPPIMELLLRVLPSAAHAYAWMSVLSLPALLLMSLLGPHARRAAAAFPPARKSSGLSEIKTALRAPGVRRTLGVALCVFFSSSLLFFFMKGFALGIGMTNAGLFFTVSTGATILVRLLGNSFFDRVDKKRALVLSLLFLAGCYGSYSLVRAPLPFLLAAAGFGAAIGVALPLLQSTLFLQSDPGKRGLTTNLFLSTMDAGLFLGPYFGGLLLDAGLSHSGLFLISAGLALVGSGLVGRSRVPLPAASAN